MAEQEKNKVGRPLKFKTAAELEAAIEKYFTDCDNRRTEVFIAKMGGTFEVPDPRPYTITGLAMALETTRETLIDYADKDEFTDTIKKAKVKIHNFTEEKLFGGAHPTGVIFNLKNNWGWHDKTETDLTSGGDKFEFTNGVPRPPKADDDNS